MAYCILGYFCAYMRYYYPIEFCTSLLNNAANDEDIVNGTALAKQKGFTIVNPKFGLTKSGYFYDKETKIIAKGLSSIKYMSEQCADELYDLAQNNYETFIDLLKDISDKTSTNARQLDLLIKIDYFSDFGNQRELLRINDEFTKLKKGEAKQISCSLIDGTVLSAIIQKYASNKTKTGIGKNYKFFDCIGYLREVEHLIRNAHLEDLDLKTKCANFADIMGYPGYITGDNKDRPVLYVMDKFIARRKKDGKQFGYNIKTKSVGSGIESTFTIFNRDYIYPVEVGDLIVCTGYERNGKYFNMTRYKPYVG